MKFFLVFEEKWKRETLKDYGGSKATSHPCWLVKISSLCLDREKREINS